MVTFIHHVLCPDHDMGTSGDADGVAVLYTGGWVSDCDYVGRNHMKVKHKVLGVVLEVKSGKDLPNDCTTYYETKGGSYIAYNDPEWEVVMPWEDVTDICEWVWDEKSKEHYIKCGSERVEGWAARYHLTKVNLRLQDGKERWCFVVKRRTNE